MSLLAQASKPSAQRWGLGALIDFLLAAKPPTQITVAIALFMEVLALIVIRDNLTLNVIMLLHPFEFIKQWQGGL